MIRDRSLISLFLCIPILVIAGLMRPQPAPIVAVPLYNDPVRRAGADAERFWVVKTHGKTQFDVILMGDSRMYRGVSPQAMEAGLDGLTVFNFGYSGGGLNPTMYAAAEQRLNPASAQKIIVLGVTPLTLTPKAASNEHYLQELKRSPDYIFLHLYGLPLLRAFQAVTFETNTETNQARQGNYYQEFYDDGWIASWSVPEDPNRTLPSFKDIFSKTPVSPQLVQALMEQTRRWRESGVRVFAFRVPSSLQMVALENRLSGFDETAFIEQFRAAGGEWFDIPLAPYHSFDGSHLTKEAALQLSVDLAELIRQVLR
jgi:hypothetical protein